MNTLSVHRDGAIVTAQIERPDKLNAQTHEMCFELRQLALVERVVPAADAQAEARALPDRLAARTPLAVTAIRDAVRARAGDTEHGFAVAGEGQVRGLASNDLGEAGAAWMEKRQPVCTGS